MKKRTSNQLLDEIARESIGRERDLSSDVMALIKKERVIQMKTKKWVLATASFLLVIVILASIPSVVQAVRNLFGFIPGVGLVDRSNPMRIQKEEVEIKVGETVIKVPQIVADSTHVRLFYQVENIPWSETAGTTWQDTCRALPWLSLPDGTRLDAKTISGNFWGGGYSRQLEFSSLPVEVNTFTFVLPCYEGTLKTETPQPVEIPLELVPAPQGMTVYPIMDLPTPTARPQSQPQAGDADKLALVLDRYTQTDAGLVLFGSLSTASTDFNLSLVEDTDIHLTDSGGNELALSQDYTLTDQAGRRTPQNLPFAYQVFTPYQTGIASLSIDRAWITRPSDITFEFDAGSDSKPGQTWKLDQSIDLNGQLVIIKEVTRSDNDDGLMISFETPQGISNLVIMDLEHPVEGGGGGSENTGFSYAGEFPGSVIRLTITSFDELLEGPWQTQIDLPEYPQGNAPAATPEACLTYDSWTAALLSSTRVLPKNPGRMLILQDILEPEYQYHLLTNTLEGTQPVDLGFGRNGSLSPDGTTIVYSTDEGMKLIRIGTRKVTLITATKRNDLGPIWSPDGKSIAFTRGPDSGLMGAAGPHKLMLMDADGSNLRELFVDNGANFAQSWMPDGHSLLFTTTQEDGAEIRSIEIASGVIHDLLHVNYQNAGVALSPNGKRIAYEVMLPGDHYGVIVSNLDGSEAKLIADAWPIVVTVPQWSPDGQWLALSVHDLSISETSPVVAYVNVDTCQITPMIDVRGYVTSWR